MVTTKAPMTPFGVARDELAGKFLVWDTLQRGPYSAVFAAHSARGGERVLLHMVLRSALARALLSESFQQAVAESAELNDSGVIRVLASGSTATFDWYSTQSVQQRMRLSAILDAGGPLPVATIVGLIEQMAAVLRHAHGMGVPHGHLSATTVFVNDDRRVRIGEFCTRRILGMLQGHDVHHSTVKETPDPATERQRLMLCDKYSLALLVHECLAGHALVIKEADSPRGSDNAEAVATAYRELDERVRARGPLTESDRAALNQAYCDFAGELAALPSVMEIAGYLGAAARCEPDEPVRIVVPDEDDERGHVVMLDEPSLVFAPQPATPKRRWPLLASVAMTVCVTWLALEQFPRIMEGNAADTVFVTRSTATLGQPIQAPTDTIVPAETTARVAPPVVAAPPQKIASSQTVSGATRPSQEQRSPRPPSGPAVTTAPTTVLASPRIGNNSSTAPRTGAKATAVVTDSVKTAVAVVPGKLFISTRPWGYLYVDGELIGNTPTTNVDIAPGTHRLRVSREGFQSFEREINVLPGQRVRLIDIVLLRQP